MKSVEPFSWRKRARAFVYAWQGLRYLLRYEHNARLHVVAACAAVVLGLVCCISASEWCLVVLCMGLVLGMEALNSAVEALADRITGEQDAMIGRAKDLGACAVTLAALASAVVGLVIFVPKLVGIIERW